MASQRHDKMVSDLIARGYRDRGFRPYVHMAYYMEDPVTRDRIFSLYDAGRYFSCWKKLHKAAGLPNGSTCPDTGEWSSAAERVDDTIHYAKCILPDVWDMRIDDGTVVFRWIECSYQNRVSDNKMLAVSTLADFLPNHGCRLEFGTCNAESTDDILWHIDIEDLWIVGCHRDQQKRKKMLSDYWMSVKENNGSWAMKE